MKIGEVARSIGEKGPDLICETKLVENDITLLSEENSVLSTSSQGVAEGVKAMRNCQLEVLNLCNDVGALPQNSEMTLKDGADDIDKNTDNLNLDSFDALKEPPAMISLPTLKDVKTNFVPKENSIISISSKVVALREEDLNCETQLVENDIDANLLNIKS